MLCPWIGSSKTHVEISIYYKKDLPESKNRYAVVAPKSKQENPEFIVYKNSHKLLFCMDVRYITMHRY